jgi:hypothetical protein
MVAGHVAAAVSDALAESSQRHGLDYLLTFKLLPAGLPT